MSTQGGRSSYKAEIFQRSLWTTPKRTYGSCLVQTFGPCNFGPRSSRCCSLSSNPTLFKLTLWLLNTIGVEVSTRCSGLFSCSSWRCWADTTENVVADTRLSSTKLAKNCRKWPKFNIKFLVLPPTQLMPRARILLSNSSFPAWKKKSFKSLNQE